MSNAHAMMPSMPASPIPPVAAFGGLVGIPYEQADCWAIVVGGLRFFGVLWPEDWREAVTREHALAVQLAPGAAVRAGDVYEFDPLPGTAQHRHVGLVIATDAGWQTRLLHAITGSESRIDRLATVRKVLKVRRVVRPVELMHIGGGGAAWTT